MNYFNNKDLKFSRLSARTRESNAWRSRRIGQENIHKNQINYERLFFYLLVIAGVAFGYSLVSFLGGPASDEGVHAGQIWQFYNRNYSVSPRLTMLPVYHHIMAFIIRQIGIYGDPLLRFQSMLVSLCVLPVYWLLAHRYFKKNSRIRVLNLFFLPLMFPFFFMIYTDIWALLAVGIVVHLVLSGKYFLSFVPAVIAVALRQDMIIWILFAFLLTLFSGIDGFNKENAIRLYKNLLTRCVPLIIVFFGFAVFVYLNKGIAVGEKDAHHATFNLTNVYVYLLCSWFVFFPLNVYSLKSISNWVRRPWVLCLILIAFPIYMGTYSNTHGYNQANALFWLHNYLLDLMTRLRWFRALLYIPIVWMLLTLLTMPWPDKRFKLLLFVIPISILLHPLVEPRYYFPAFAFLCVWRPNLPFYYELISLFVSIPLAAFITFGTATGKFFI